MILRPRLQSSSQCFYDGRQASKGAVFGYLRNDRRRGKKTHVHLAPVHLLKRFQGDVHGRSTDLAAASLGHAGEQHQGVQSTRRRKSVAVVYQQCHRGCVDDEVRLREQTARFRVPLKNSERSSRILRSVGQHVSEGREGNLRTDARDRIAEVFEYFRNCLAAGVSGARLQELGARKDFAFRGAREQCVQQLARIVDAQRVAEHQIVSHRFPCRVPIQGQRPVQEIVGSSRLVFLQDSADLRDDIYLWLVRGFALVDKHSRSRGENSSSRESTPKGIQKLAYALHEHYLKLQGLLSFHGQFSRL